MSGSEGSTPSPLSSGSLPPSHAHPLQEHLPNIFTVFFHNPLRIVIDCSFRTVQPLAIIWLFTLKVPKRENFSLAFFAQSEPTWVCDLGSGEKNRIFYQVTPFSDGFCFFAAY